MATAVTVSRQLALPAVLTPAERDRLRLLFGRVETGGGRRGTILARFAPTPAERTAYLDRLATISDALSPAPRAEIALAVKDMLRGFPTIANLDSDTKRGMLVAYVGQLEPYPAWAVKQGIQSCLNEGSDFAPAHAKVRMAAYGATVELQRERAMIKAVLDAEVRRELTAEERAAAVARWKERRRMLVAE